MATTISQLAIGAADRTSDFLRAELWRTMNGVGAWKVALRNTGGKYNNTFDIQNQFLIDVNGIGNTLMQGRVDGPGVTLQGVDVEDTWDEYVILSGYDQTQDFLFHNDFEEAYPVPTQTLNSLLNNVINVQLAGLTNITYAPVGGTPIIGNIEFKRGGGFLSTMQEAFQRAEYLFYVNDTYALNIGAPGFSDSGVTIQCVAGSATNNVIGGVDFQRRDGNKLYNKIYVYGKSPQFDAYTEHTSSRWTLSTALNWTLSDETTTIANVVGNQASLRSDYTGVAVPPPFSAFVLDFSDMLQDEVDMSSGEIGFWWRYAGGNSGAQACARIELQDSALNQINFFSGNSIPGGGVASNVNSTRTLRGIWGWCRAPVGYDADTGGAPLPDQWYNMPAAGNDFLWDSVTDIAIGYMDAAAATHPNEMEIDGLRLPFPALGFAEDAVAQANYRIRPLPITLPYIRHQLTLENKATQLLTHHKNTGIDLIKFITEGNLGLRYAGQTITVNIPDLGLNNDLFYMSQIHHIIEPYTDVSEGYGFDWVTEIEAVPISSITYDMGRLRDGPLYSASQLGTGGNMGQRMK